MIDIEKTKKVFNDIFQRILDSGSFYSYSEYLTLEQAINELERLQNFVEELNELYECRGYFNNDYMVKDTERKLAKLNGKSFYD
jgi:hypothetical protein